MDDDHENSNYTNHDNSPIENRQERVEPHEPVTEEVCPNINLTDLVAIADRNDRNEVLPDHGDLTTSDVLRLHNPMGYAHIRNRAIRNQGI